MSLTDIEWPDTLKRISDFAFSNCSKLNRVTLPSSTKNIGDYAFIRCDRLTSVFVPESVVSVGIDAFDKDNKNLCIYGISGSYIQAYAKENKLRFKVK